MFFRRMNAKFTGQSNFSYLFQQSALVRNQCYNPSLYLVIADQLGSFQSHELRSNRTNTRMHSSRMHTVRCSGGGEVVWPGGVWPGEGVSAWPGEGVSAWPGGIWPGGGGVCHGVSAQGVSARGFTPPPCGQTDTCENITFPQLLLRTVIDL